MSCHVMSRDIMSCARYEQQCSTVNQQQCSTVNEQECSTTTEQVGLEPLEQIENFQTLNLAE